MKLQGVLEGILFVVGDEGITLKALCETMEITETEAKNLLKNLREVYEDDNRGIRITFLGDAFKLTTKKEHKEYYQKLIQNPETNNLSNAALETLAIVAYNAPITRLEVEELRGVNSSNLIRKLVAKGLIKEDGKSSLPGRPNLYRTTKEFLDYFGLATLSDLPKFEEITTNTEEIDLFTSIYKDEV
ncbi:MAG: SMC-Scp complex subunit ScpB [Bacilli bacterium]|nr:SMC-Scp complex subunit ScpB [Bacilli bacterium]